jgi:hypothetical protein
MRNRPHSHTTTGVLTMARQPEAKLVQRIKAFVVEKGGRPFKIVGSDEGYQEIGIPDLLICYKGRFIGGEVKQPGEPLRPRQKLVLREIFEADGVAAVLETVGHAAILLLRIDREVSSGKSTGLFFHRGTFHDVVSFHNSEEYFTEG